MLLMQGASKTKNFVGCVGDCKWHYCKAISHAETMIVRKLKLCKLVQYGKVTLISTV